MAEYLIQEETLVSIGNAIRHNAQRKVGDAILSPDEMPHAVDDVYLEGYENGYNDIISNPNTSGDVDVTVSTTSVTVIIPSGYYDEEIEKVLDVQNGDLDPIVDAAYDRGADDGYNNGYDTGYQNGYNDGINAGGGGGGGSPSTVWEITSKPSLTSLPTSSSAAIEVSFTSNGIDFNGIYASSSLGLFYRKPDGSTQNVYAPKMGIWVNSAYKTIATHGEINNATLLTWLQANATLLSIGSE